MNDVAAWIVALASGADIAIPGSRLGEFLAALDGHPAYDLARLTLTDRPALFGHGLGIDRSKMPQVPARARGQFLDRLAADGIGHETGTVDPRELHPTQDGLASDKVASMWRSMSSGRFPEDANPILCAADGYVLDGHHRWAAAVARAYDQAMTVPVVIVGCDIETLAAAAAEFAAELGIANQTLDAKAVRNRFGTQLTPAGQARLIAAAAKPGISGRAARATLSRYGVYVNDPAGDARGRVAAPQRYDRGAPLSQAEHARYWRALENLPRTWRGGGPHETIVQHQGTFTKPDGSTVTGWSPERRALHRQLIEDTIGDAIARGVPKNREAVMIGGLPGSGKSTIIRTGIAGIRLGPDGDPDRPASHMVINPDTLAESLIAAGGVDQMPGFSPLDSRPLVQREVSELSNRLTARAVAEGLNVILDQTMGDESLTRARVGMLTGYKVDGVFVDIAPRKSIWSVLTRHRQGVNAWRNGQGLGGRPVPIAFIRQSEPDGSKVKMPDGSWAPARSTNRVVFDRLARKGVFRTATLVDNQGDPSFRGRDASGRPVGHPTSWTFPGQIVGQIQPDPPPKPARPKVQADYQGLPIVSSAPSPASLATAGGRPKPIGGNGAQMFAPRAKPSGQQSFVYTQPAHVRGRGKGLR